MDSLQQKPGTKIKLTCPHDHALFPKGVTVDTLYKNYAIRLNMNQRTKEGYDWSKSDAFFRKQGLSESQILASHKKQTNPDLCDTYRLNEGQMKMLGGRTCAECDGRGDGTTK